MDPAHLFFLSLTVKHKISYPPTLIYLYAQIPMERNINKKIHRHVLTIPVDGQVFQDLIIF